MREAARLDPAYAEPHMAMARTCTNSDRKRRRGKRFKPTCAFILTRHPERCLSSKKEGPCGGGEGSWPATSPISTKKMRTLAEQNRPRSRGEPPLKS